MNDKTKEILDSLPVGVYRLVDGSLMVGWQIAATLKYHDVGYPMAIVKTISEDGQHAIVLEDWLPFSMDEHHFLYCDNVIAFTKANLQLKEFYFRFIVKSILSSNLEEFTSNIPNSLSDFLSYLDPKESN